jgi:hypothetical protein
MSSSAGLGPRGPTSSKERPQKAPRRLTDAELLSVELFPLARGHFCETSENRPQSPSETVSTISAVTNQGHLDMNVSCGIDFMFSGADHLHFTGMIAAGSWERARVMETSSRRTLRGPSRSSQSHVYSRSSLSAVPGQARRCSCTTAVPQPPSDRRRRRGRGASGSARSAPRCGPSRASGPQRALRPQVRRFQ